jgi:hypothetical protein
MCSASARPDLHWVADMQQPQTILRFSDQLYKRFLIAYPVEYRQELSDEMAQVFRDLCREVYEQKGMLGFLGIWSSTLIDLVKTALEERIKDTTNMTKNKFFRLSGWALMLAGPLAVLGFSISEFDAANFDAPNDTLARFRYFSDPFGGKDILFEASPILLILSAFLFYTIGLYGFRLRFGESGSKVGSMGLGLSVISSSVVALASIPMLIFTGNIWWGIWVYSLAAMFTGLTIFGVTALNTRPLPFWNALPLLAGIWFPALTLISQIGFDELMLARLWNATGWILMVGSIALGYVLQRSEGTQTNTN